jgi:hypothetical protein
MKTCTYCGVENSEPISNCASCGSELPEVTTPPVITSDFKPLKIKANEAFIQRYLEISPKGVAFRETALGGSAKKFGFHQVDSILLSSNNVLSFQVGQEVFSISTKPADATHQALISRFLEEVGKTAPITTSN